MKRALMVMLAVLLLAVPAGAVSNKKAEKAFDKKVASLKKKDPDVYSKYVDLTGDKVSEAVVEYQSGGGSGRVFLVYAYVNGKAKKVLSYQEYGLSKLYAYKSNGSLVAWMAGHGNETYAYFGWKNGKYALVAQRGRVSKKGGAAANGSWSYYDGKDQKITKASFQTLIQEVQKGKKTTIPLA